MRGLRFALAGLAGAMLVAGVARAQLSSAQVSCIDNYNNKLRLVSQQAAKSATGCLKNAAAGSEPDPEGCVIGGLDDKIAAKEAKVTALFGDGAKCDPVPPIVQNPAIGNAAHRSAVTSLMHAFFGNPIGRVSTAGTDAKCTGKAVQRATQAYVEIIKQQRTCKKAGLKSGAIANSVTLADVCGTFAQIDADAKAAGRLAKLDADVRSACAEPGIDLAALFGGLPATCHGTAAALSACLQAHARCRACVALRSADGALTMDCDAFDDEAANLSCTS